MMLACMSAGHAAPYRLKKPVERSVAHGHPWIYRDALEGSERDAPEPGTVVTVLDRRGRFLARGLAESGPIGVRVWTRRDRPVDEDLLRDRVRAAFELRARLRPPDTDAYRLLHGEGDRTPGLVVDRYGAYAVLRLDGAAARRWRTRAIEVLRPHLAELAVHTLLVRTGSKREGTRVEMAYGTPPEDLVEVRERGMVLPVDLMRGQKTGLFLDHRDSRYTLRSLCHGARVLNLYGYTGGFSISAGLGGASEVDTVDVAAAAIELADLGWTRNGLGLDHHRGHAVDAETFLTKARAGRDHWEVVVADPPSFAPSESAKPAALKAYKALHRASLEVLMPGGLYLAASCSSHVSRPDFEQTLREAAHAVRRPLQVLARGGAGFDHPVPLGFPEGEYLTMTLCRCPD